MNKYADLLDMPVERAFLRVATTAVRTRYFSFQAVSATIAVVTAAWFTCDFLHRRKQKTKISINELILNL